MDEAMRINVVCPACGEVVELVIREIEATSRGSGIVEATIEASSYKHRCKKLGGVH